MEVDKEYRKFELSEEQRVTIASMVLTNFALNLRTHLAMHHKVPKTWKDDTSGPGGVGRGPTN
jgi:hypothetical protein